jgi:hypothetical protein
MPQRRSATSLETRVRVAQQQRFTVSAPRFTRSTLTTANGFKVRAALQLRRTCCSVSHVCSRRSRQPYPPTHRRPLTSPLIAHPTLHPAQCRAHTFTHMYTHTCTLAHASAHSCTHDSCPGIQHLVTRALRRWWGCDHLRQPPSRPTPSRSIAPPKRRPSPAGGSAAADATSHTNSRHNERPAVASPPPPPSARPAAPPPSPSSSRSSAASQAEAKEQVEPQADHRKRRIPSTSSPSSSSTPPPSSTDDSSNNEPYLSIILAARNDGHEGNFLVRLQNCLDQIIVLSRHSPNLSLEGNTPCAPHAPTRCCSSPSSSSSHHRRMEPSFILPFIIFPLEMAASPPCPLEDHHRAFSRC